MSFSYAQRVWAWFWIVGMLVAVAGCYLYARQHPPRLMPESLYVVTFDDSMVEVKDPAGEVRTVPWDQITRVGIRTTDEGPFLPDVFWGIHSGGEEPTVVFPGGASGESELLAELQRRLRGFSNDDVVAAMSCTSNAYFQLWPPSS
jgi:hypothetical protein